MEREEDQRKHYTLTAAELELIAAAGAEKALTKMSTDLFVFVGKGILSRIFWIVGSMGLALYFYLQSKGVIK